MTPSLLIFFERHARSLLNEPLCLKPEHEDPLRHVNRWLSLLYKTGVRRFVLKDFVSGVLDYQLAVGVWGFRILDEFWGRVVTELYKTVQKSVQ